MFNIFTSFEVIFLLGPLTNVFLQLFVVFFFILGTFILLCFESPFISNLFPLRTTLYGLNFFGFNYYLIIFRLLSIYRSNLERLVHINNNPFVPVYLFLFLFLCFNNLLGLLPYSLTLTSHVFFLIYLTIYHLGAALIIGF
jgi:hypothetical protein